MTNKIKDNSNEDKKYFMERTPNEIIEKYARLLNFEQGTIGYNTLLKMTEEILLLLLADQENNEK